MTFIPLMLDSYQWQRSKVTFGPNMVDCLQPYLLGCEFQGQGIDLTSSCLLAPCFIAHLISHYFFLPFSSLSAPSLSFPHALMHFISLTSLPPPSPSASPPLLPAQPRLRSALLNSPFLKPSLSL